MTSDFDAIVVGSGVSGGWAAKELTERGLKVLLLERGRHITHREDYITEGKGNWELPYRGQIPETELANDYAIQKDCYAFTDFTKHFFVNDREHPYETAKGRPFSYIRGHHLGGRSLQWHRQCYRWSDIDFGANKKDGHGVDWPIRYSHIAPWYDHVEAFAGISGNNDGLPQLPDGVFQPPFKMNCVEKAVKARMEAAFPERNLIIGRAAHLTEPTDEQLELGRGRCMNRNECQRGCSFGAYFSSLSATLPAAERTGRLSIVTDAIVSSVNYDREENRVTSVNVIDANTKSGKTFSARMIFLCASTLGTTQIMLNSVSERFPNGLGNSSGTLGHYLMDHIGGSSTSGIFDGHSDKYHSPRRPNECYIPRFTNLTDEDPRVLRLSGRRETDRLEAGHSGRRDRHGTQDFPSAARPLGVRHRGLRRDAALRTQPCLAGQEQERSVGHAHPACRLCSWRERKGDDPGHFGRRRGYAAGSRLAECSHVGKPDTARAANS